MSRLNGPLVSLKLAAEQMPQERLKDLADRSKDARVSGRCLGFPKTRDTFLGPHT